MNKKALIAEFIGTFTLIFIGVGSIAANHASGGFVGVTGIALAHGLAIAVMATAMGPASGGHLNPAVTIALWFTKNIKTVPAIGYIVAQCLGAICAALLLKESLPQATVAAIHMGTPGLAMDISVKMGLLIEAILTFFLVLAVYGTAVDPRAPKCGALFIGLAVALDILMGGPFTGGAMNPARHLGPALVSGDMTNLWLYWAGPVIGAVAAAQIYRTQLEK